MKFEVINTKGTSEMSCRSIKYIPTDRELQSMSDAGYKFKIDGKYVNRKKIKEFINNNTEEK